MAISGRKKKILLRLCGDKKHFSGIIRQYNLHENNLFSFYCNRKCCLNWLHVIDYNGNILATFSQYNLFLSEKLQCGEWLTRGKCGKPGVDQNGYAFRF